MKKTYINPSMRVVKMVNKSSMLSGSQMDGNRTYTSGGGITLGGRESDGDFDEEW